MRERTVGTLATRQRHTLFTLPEGLVYRRASASGRKGATRWEVFVGECVEERWHGDLVRWMPENEWSWQPASASFDPDEGTLEEALAALERTERTAYDRDEQDYCERGTFGCSVLHTRDSDCATW
jgi:hypothetical protein